MKMKAQRYIEAVERNLGNAARHTSRVYTGLSVADAAHKLGIRVADISTYRAQISALVAEKGGK